MNRAFLVALFFLLWLAPARAATVVATLDRASIPVGDSATLSIQITGGNPQGAPTFPDQPNLTIQYTGASSQMQVVNGRSSSSVILSYTVTPAQPGAYNIPAVQVPVDGGLIATRPVTLTATKGQAGGLPVAFVRIAAAKTNVYVGEAFPVELKVYGLNIKQLQAPTLKSDGFTIGAMGQHSAAREQFGNAIYSVYSFPVSVAAAKAGNLNLGPAEALMDLSIPLRQRGGDIFDQMFGSFQTKQINAASDPSPIHVNPLPTENVPPSFNGAVGNFDISIKASPTNVAVGDPITLDIKVQGRGAFDTVKLPDFGWKDFTFYQPNPATTNLDALGLQAIKSFDQVIIPQRAGLTAIPALVFSFFDPDQRAYRTVQRPAIPITVKATGQGQAQPTVVADRAPPENRRTEADIVHIKPALGQMVWTGAPLPLRPSFIILELLPIGLWISALIWRKRTDRLAKNPRLRRRLEVSRQVAKGLNELREAAAKNENEKFFATGFHLLQEQLGERLDVPGAAITEAAVDDRLPKLAASPELIALLRQLFQACNQARYAGATVAGMEALIPKFETALREIQKLPAAP